MKIWMVKRTGGMSLPLEDVSINDIGQKAWGLCHMPTAWTRPFFVIDKEFMAEIYQNNNLDEIISSYLPNIISAIEELKLGSNVIIRSSGEEEGMEERGKYESIESSVDKIKTKLYELIGRMEGYSEIKERGIPLIVQAYVNNDILGHVSNERRFAEEKRDFVVEYKNRESGEIETTKIHLRNWRESFDIEKEKNSKLIVSDNIIKTLKKACAYYYYKNERVHLEFVCENNVIYLVQCDIEIEDKDAVNPNDYDVTMFEGKIFSPQILRKIEDSDKGKYKKIDNVFIYREVGERIPPLLILDDAYTLGQLKKGKITEALNTDLNFLVNQSLIIRTNIISDDIRISQLSKRSNEIRDLDEARNFLITTTKKLQQEGINNYIFILHNFIPAKLAAFVNAKPMQPVVEIQSLWGLPEGLYYNSHDRIIVNTVDINVENMDRSRFVIKKVPSYKEKFIAPNEQGKWVVKKIKPPYDWKCSISNEDTIKDIAYRARKIVENVGEELSIMWFVGIDEKYYGTDSMPWYHEKYDRNNFYYTTKSNQYKKKYFYEKEVLVETKEDLVKLELMDSNEIGIVRIQPKDDDLLRSRDFIEKVGSICNKKGINILLEGSVLAHSFYQLINTGATVLNACEIKEYEEKVEYNKLVRDKIPQIIRENGELVKCVTIEGVGLIRQIKNKLIEETYEVIDSSRREEVLEELVDLEEICIALEGNINLLSKDTKIINCSINKNIIFDLTCLENKKQIQTVHHDKYSIIVSLERTGSTIQIDFIFRENNKLLKKENDKLIINPYMKDILKNVLNIWGTTEKSECLKLLCEIQGKIKKLLKEYNCSEEQFSKLRQKKKNKKGAFEKGYILLKTSYSRREQMYTFLTENKQNNLIEKRYSPIQEKARVDVDNLSQNGLLIRLTMPVYIRKNEWIIKREKIYDYFGEDVGLRITKEYCNTKIMVGLEFLYNPYVQLELDFN